MRFTDLVKISFSSLAAHRGRSVLTVLGVVIGIGAIMVVMSVGESAEKLITREVQSFGAENVFINPGKPSEGLFSFSTQMTALLSKSLTERDVESLKNSYNIPDAVYVNPTVSGSLSVSYGSETKTANVIGSGAEAFSIYNLAAYKGRLFTEEEVRGSGAVAVLGKNIVEELFGPKSVNVIGEYVKIKDKKFKVIGTFSSLSSSMFGIDDLIIVPYTTMQQYVLGIRHFHEMAVRGSSADVVPRMVSDIKRTLRENHNIQDSKDDDFIVSTQEDIIESVNQILNAVTVFLAFVAAVSLVVGGIGVMNIMFVSVTERTREIGLRKSVGATNKNILAQFLIEAAMLTGGGGVLGVVFGAALTFLITLVGEYATQIDFPFVFSEFGAVLGVVVAGGTGIIFGIFPAYQASKKSPVEALRYE